MFISSLQSSEVQGLSEFVVKQVRKMFCTFIAMALYCQRDECIVHMFCCTFVYKYLKISYVNGASYIQRALDSEIVKLSLARALSQQTRFEVQMFFNLLLLVVNCSEKKLPVLSCS